MHSWVLQGICTDAFPTFQQSRFRARCLSITMDPRGWKRGSHSGTGRGDFEARTARASGEESAARHLPLPVGPNTSVDARRKNMLVWAALVAANARGDVVKTRWSPKEGESKAMDVDISSGSAAAGVASSAGGVSSGSAAAGSAVTTQPGGISTGSAGAGSAVVQGRPLRPAPVAAATSARFYACLLYTSPSPRDS